AVAAALRFSPAPFWGTRIGMFGRLLIANRGEVAVRIIRACRELGVTAIAAHSTADRGALHVRLADERICIGPPRAEQSYQSIPAVVSAALATRADAVHPGYGFLAENGDLAEALRHSGVAFVGPRARHLRLMGDKARARHVEVQLLGDRHGRLVALGERDCSVQRRHQKILEEAPAPALAPGLGAALAEAALAGARSLRYENLGTMEFLVGADGAFHFLEMNPRLQVEHTVTEAVTGIDLVAESLRVAAGEPLALDEPAPAARGHAIECRIYAEASGRPCGGIVRRLHVPGGPGIRVDLGVGAGEPIAAHH